MTGRRLFRVSLRALLLLTTLFCLVLGKVSIEARRRKQAVDWVRAGGGQVIFDWEIRDFARPVRPTLPGVAWVQSLVGKRYFENVRVVNLIDCDVSDITLLQYLPEIEWLYLSRNKISDVSPLSGLRQLKQLRLDGNPLESSDVEALVESLPDLRPFDYSGVGTR
jgi:hypothetical protein